MPPVPVYSDSPINAAKASGPTSQGHPDNNNGTVSELSTTTSTQPDQQSYPPAAPGARATLPIPTASAQTPLRSLQPTTTQAVENMVPPLPQPGAVPIPPTSGMHVPPPPKTGEPLRPEHTQSLPHMPPQMSYAPPVTTQRQGSSTVPLPPPPTSGPVHLPDGGPTSDLSHPPGYQQDVHASEFSSHQRAAHIASVQEQPGLFAGNDGINEEGLWGTAKKWATAAGDGLAAAESEVWKRINKE